MTIGFRPWVNAGGSPSLASATLWAGLVAAVVEMVPVVVIQGLALGVAPLRIFQAIASGLLGARAYDGGARTAVLGELLHLLISVGAAALFVVVASRHSLILRRPVLAGLAYGVAVWFVMTYIIVPLSSAAFKPATNPALIAVSILVHMLAFGLPIAMVSRRLLSK